MAPILGSVHHWVTAFSAVSLGAWLMKAEMGVDPDAGCPLPRSRPVGVDCFRAGALWRRNALIGLYEFFGGSGALVLLIDNRFVRAFGTLGQPNHLAASWVCSRLSRLMAARGYSYRLWALWRSGQALKLSTFTDPIFTAQPLSYGGRLIASWSRGSWSASPLRWGLSCWRCREVVVWRGTAGTGRAAHPALLVH